LLVVRASVHIRAPCPVPAVRDHRPSDPAATAVPGLRTPARPGTPPEPPQGAASPSAGPGGSGDHRAAGV